MKLSEKTLKVLENFSNINPSIVIKASNDDKTKITTKDRSSFIYSEAIIDETFDNEVVLYEVKNLLQLVNRYPDAEIVTGETYMDVKSKNGKARLVYTNKNSVIAPTKEFEFRNLEFNFDLPYEVLGDVLQMGAILNLPHIRFFTDNGKIILQALDHSGATANTYDKELGDTTEEFSVFVKRENLKMLENDYKVSTDGKVMMQFIGNPDDSIKYVSALEKVRA